MGLIGGDGVFDEGIGRRGFLCFWDVDGEGDGSELGFKLDFDLGVGLGGAEFGLGFEKKAVIWLCFRTRGERPLLRRRDMGKGFWRF